MNVIRKKDESFGLPAVQVTGFAVLFAALLAALFLFPGQVELILGLAVAAVGAGKLVAAHLEGDENDELPPASRAFRELADPSRPLTANDPLTPAPPRPALPGEAGAHAES
jgi:hypothetical protein